MELDGTWQREQQISFRAILCQNCSEEIMDLIMNICGSTYLILPLYLRECRHLGIRIILVEHLDFIFSSLKSYCDPCSPGPPSRERNLSSCPGLPSSLPHKCYSSVLSSHGEITTDLLHIADIPPSLCEYAVEVEEETSEEVLSACWEIVAVLWRDVPEDVVWCWIWF